MAVVQIFDLSANPEQKFIEQFRIIQSIDDYSSPPGGELEIPLLLLSTFEKSR